MDNLRDRDAGYDFIRFLATLLVIIFHFHSVCLEAGIPFPSWIESLFAHSLFRSGGVGVGLFFILSGALTWRGSKESFAAAGFYKKRAVRVLIPQWIGFLASFLVAYMMDASIVKDHTAAEYVIAFMGLNYSGVCWSDALRLSVPWLIGEWFTAVILLIILAYPLLRWLFCRHRVIGTALVTTVFAVNLFVRFLSYYDGWFSITNGFMFFWLGMLFEEYRPSLDPRLLVLPVIVCLALLIWSPDRLFGIAYLPVFLFVVCLFPILRRIRFKTKTTDLICKYSYEIYLLHHRVFIILIPLMLSPLTGAIQLLIAFFVFSGLSVLLAFLLRAVSDRLSMRLGKELTINRLARRARDRRSVPRETDD